MKYLVICEPTPNPESMKFLVDKPICSEIFEVDSPEKAKRSPLAAKIMGFPWAKSVFLSENFLTVTKEEWVEWDILTEPLADMIKEHLESGGQVLLPELKKPELKKPESSAQSSDSKSVRLIKEIIENEIQPAVAMDGGHIDFVSYENGKVYLDLQGACSGCPSSSYTLKEGIETRLKQVLPEIEEVIPV